MGTSNRVELVVPGLFGPMPVLPEDLPDLPSLSRILGRADLETVSGLDPVAVLLDLFGIQVDPGRDPPSAPFCHLADAPEASPDGYWLHADPIHLRPDRDRLLLFDMRHSGLERAEADSLVDLFNRHFGADGLHLEAATADRWYLRTESAPRLRTRQLADVLGRSVAPSYLDGDDAACWMGWLNEAQMLFHQAEVNRLRESAGKPTVSGIWPWGGGSLPAAAPECDYASVFAADPLALGLARAAKLKAYPLPERPTAMTAAGPQGRMLVYWDGLRPAVLDVDAGAWIQGLLRLSAWLDELLVLLKGSRVDEIALLPCDGTRLVVTRGALRRFWRRAPGMAARLQGMPRNE